MKKFISAVLMLILALSVLALPAAATETTETEDEGNVHIDIVAKFSEHPDADFAVYFRNVETDEVIRFVLRGSRPNDFPLLEEFAGTYKLERCALALNEIFTYEVVSQPEDLIIQPGEYTHYVFRIGETATRLDEPFVYESYSDYYSSEGLFVEEDAKLERKVNRILIVCAVVLSVYPISWIIIAIQGRRNFYKRVVAQLMKHIFIAFAGFTVGCMFGGIFGIPPIITIIFCTCFPFGIIGILVKLGGYIEAPSEQDIRDMSIAREYRSADENAMRDSISGFLWVLLLLVCGFIGIVALPLVLIKDIRTVIKCRPLNFKYR